MLISTLLYILLCGGFFISWKLNQKTSLLEGLFEFGIENDHRINLDQLEDNNRYKRNDYNGRCNNNGNATGY